MPFADKEKEKEYKKQYYLKNKCEHGRHKSQCRDCGGSAVCPHGRAKNICIECGGASICEHKRRRSKCKDCGGTSICEHNREKNQCRECGGNSFCEHSRIKKNCKECCGAGICEHNRIRSSCKECFGGSRCKHNVMRFTCKECRPESRCEHDIMKNTCKYCSLQTYLVNLQRCRIYSVLKNKELTKAKSTVEYLDCTSEYFMEFIKAKMVEGMTFDNIHIDHIKPVSSFDLQDPEEFLKCCHYTNMQPLLAVDNQEKSNKWTGVNEKFWNDNIIYKDFTEIYYTK